MVFLMYRVELKGSLKASIKASKLVPNVPCGVERKIGGLNIQFLPFVPNVPCGVESLFTLLRYGKTEGFLMYRVELKVGTPSSSSIWTSLSS